MGRLWESAKEFLRLSVPATVEGESINVPAFVIPLETPEPLEGTIKVEIEPETKAAVVKVALKKRKPAVKKTAAKKKAVKKA